MSQPRVNLWVAEADIDEDVDIPLNIGSYGEIDQYADGGFEACSMQSMPAYNISRSNPTSPGRCCARRPPAAYEPTKRIRPDPRSSQGRELLLFDHLFHADKRLSSSLSISIKPSSRTTSLKSLLRMRVGGTNSQKSTTRGQNGPRPSLSPLWLTMVRQLLHHSRPILSNVFPHRSNLLDPLPRIVLPTRIFETSAQHR